MWGDRASPKRTHRLVQAFLLALMVGGALWLAIFSPPGRPVIAGPTTASIAETPIVEYPMTTPGSQIAAFGPLSIADGGSGSFWIAEFSSGSIAHFFSDNGTFEQYAVPGNKSMPAYITVDSLGKVWFSDQGGSGAIWKFDPSTGNFSRYPTLCEASDPVGVLVDSQQNVWFAEDSCDRLGELVYPSYVEREYQLPQAGSGPAELAMRGTRIWITESLGDRIASFDTVTKSFREFTPVVPFASPVGVVLDSQGDVWVSEHGGSAIVKLDPGTGSFTEYPTSPPPAAYGFANSAPATLVIDRQGRLWFVEHFSNRIGRYDPRTGKLDEFTIPSTGVYSIESALDDVGNFWFTEFTGDKVGEVPGNASVPLQVSVVKGASGYLQAGQTAQAEFMVANKLNTSLSVALAVTVTFSSNGYTSDSMASLDTNSLLLGPGGSAPVVVYLTPPSSDPAGNYSLGVSASMGAESTVGDLTFTVVPNMLDLFLTQTLPDLLTIAMVGLLFGNFVVWGEVKKGEKRVAGNGVRTLLPALGSLLLISTALVHPALAKCPGLPGLGSSSGGPNYVTVIVLVVQTVATVILAYFMIIGWLRLRRANLTNRVGQRGPQ